MTRLAKPLKEFIEEQGWKDEITEDEERGFAQLATRIRIANQSWRLFVDTHDEQDAIAVYCYLPFNALPDDGELRIVMWTNFAEVALAGKPAEQALAAREAEEASEEADEE